MKKESKIAKMWKVERLKETKWTKICCFLGFHNEKYCQRLSGLYSAWVCKYCLNVRDS